MSQQRDERTADAVGEERARIAREMHDGMAQTLAYVLTKAQAALTYLRRQDSSRAEAQVAELITAAREAYGDARETILALRTQPAAGVRLADVVTQYAEDWSAQSGLSVELDLAPAESLALTPTNELQLMRIVQEALTNVRKHAAARSVRLRLAREGDAVAGCIEDDGEGFDPERRERSAQPRFGLAVMRERAEAAGGRLAIDSAPGRGTRVTFDIPARDD